MARKTSRCWALEDSEPPKIPELLHPGGFVFCDISKQAKIHLKIFELDDLRVCC